MSTYLLSTSIAQLFQAHSFTVVWFPFLLHEYTAQTILSGPYHSACPDVSAHTLDDLRVCQADKNMRSSFFAYRFYQRQRFLHLTLLSRIS